MLSCPSLPGIAKQEVIILQSRQFLEQASSLREFLDQEQGLQDEARLSDKGRHPLPPRLFQQLQRTDAQTSRLKCGSFALGHVPFIFPQSPEESGLLSAQHFSFMRQQLGSAADGQNIECGGMRIMGSSGL